MLLQQGHNVADVLYFIGEDVPKPMNAWPNSMQRGRPAKEAEPLDPAGLIGPVRLAAVETLPLPLPL